MKNNLVAEELNEAERKLRSLHLHDPKRYSDRPCREEDVRSLLVFAFSGGPEEAFGEEGNASGKLEANFQEPAFIPADMDINFLRHLRYMPAFWHRHTFFELLCVLKGSCYNIFDDRELVMRQGDICIHAPGTVHAVSAFSDDAVLVNILLRKSTFEQVFFGLMRGNSILAGFFRRSFYRTSEVPYLLFHTGDDEALVDLLLRAGQEAETDHRYKRQMVNALISQFFILLLENHEQSIEVPEFNLKGKNVDLMQIINYINANFATVTLRQLSAHFNYSERQLQRIIPEATGMPFRENIQNQKMQRAASLLCSSDLPVSAVCDKVGYPSQNNFRKIFFRYYGMTPSEYRRRNEGS